MNAMSFVGKWSILLALSAAAGCASTPFIQETPVLFPPSPSTPRLRYETSVRGSMDFKRLNIIDRILGTNVTREIDKPFDVYAQGEKVYVSDTSRQVVHVIDFKTQKVSSLGDSGVGRLRMPLGVRGARDGTIYVSDGVLKTVRVYTSAGEHVMDIGKPGELQNPSGIAVNSGTGRLYIADPKAHDIKVYSTKGDFLFQFGSGGDGDGKFQFPSFITVDSRNGEVYVSDTNNFRVQVFDQDGKFIRKFGMLGDAPGFFQRPKGIGIDSEGNSYIVESVFNNFQIFNDRGEVLTWIGWGGTQGGGAFRSPAGLYVDENDRIFVVDVLNRRVQVFQYFSEKWKQQHPDLYRQYVEGK
jgi:DNA-binding beta-propeller fold protein YncE